MREQRVYDRIDFISSFDCRCYFNTNGEQLFFEEEISFETLNLSVGGLLVKSKTDLEETMVLQYTFYLECVPYIVLSRIRWKEITANGYFYGLEFLTIPNMLHRHLHDYVDRYISENLIMSR